jgi:L-lactate dehydrogenase
VSDICLSVPTVLNRNGVRETLEIPLDEKEIKAFQESASIIKNVVDSLGL